MIGRTFSSPGSQWEAWQRRVCIVTNQYEWAWLASAAATLCFANTSLDPSYPFSDGRYVFMLNMGGLILPMLTSMLIEIIVQALKL